MDQLHGNDAIFSDDGMYRYLLCRTWVPRLLWVLLNPSTAGNVNDDQTVRRCVRFTRDWQLRLSEWQYYGLDIVNLFAYRETSTVNLTNAPNPIGPDNDRYIIEAAQRASRVVVAWGEGGAYMERGRDVCKLLKEHAPQPLYCLGKIQDGSPRHPLYVPRSTDPIPYSCDTAK